MSPATMLVQWIVDGSLWPHLGATLSAMAMGYVAGCTLGIGLGLLLGFLPGMRRSLMPYLAALYAMPKIALAPLFVMLVIFSVALTELLSRAEARLGGFAR